jgi:hypothetical protein
MSSWNYRVVLRAGEFSIYSAYYDDNGHCHSISVDPAHLYGDTPDELAAELERFKAALAKPVLQYEELDKASAREE